MDSLPAATAPTAEAPPLSYQKQTLSMMERENWRHCVYVCVCVCVCVRAYACEEETKACYEW